MAAVSVKRSITSSERLGEIAPVDFQKQWLDYLLVEAVVLLLSKNAPKIRKLGGN